MDVISNVPYVWVSVFYACSLMIPLHLTVLCFHHAMTTAAPFPKKRQETSRDACHNIFSLCHIQRFIPFFLYKYTCLFLKSAKFGQFCTRNGQSETQDTLFYAHCLLNVVAIGSKCTKYEPSVLDLHRQVQRLGYRPDAQIQDSGKHNVGAGPPGE